jgi:DNA-binding NtrC family response regulator
MSMSPHEPKAEGALGVSEAMREVEMLLRRIADTDGALLITGESGVGKEGAAKFVHQISTRADEPFVPINCAAIPTELLEGELFGYEKGAFTGALQRAIGKIESAKRGTLFFDEITDVLLPMQVKLLRLIEEGAFTRVGGETAIEMHARIICASRPHLESSVAEGHFRHDLHDRISVITVVIPPLRDRTDDVLPLAKSFMREFSKAFHRDIKGFSAEAEEALLSHSWPGNVRELRNCIERAVTLSQTPWISAEALFPGKGSGSKGGPPEPTIVDPRGPRSGPGGAAANIAEVRARAERQHIRAVLADVDNSIEGAARRLGVLRRRSGSGDPGSGAPLAPTPATPDRPKPRSGSAAADVEATGEPPQDAVARRTA